MSLQTEAGVLHTLPQSLQVDPTTGVINGIVKLFFVWLRGVVVVQLRVSAKFVLLLLLGLLGGNRGRIPLISFSILTVAAQAHHRCPSKIPNQSKMSGAAAACPPRHVSGHLNAIGNEVQLAHCSGNVSW